MKLKVLTYIIIYRDYLASSFKEGVIALIRGSNIYYKIIDFTGYAYRPKRKLTYLRLPELPLKDLVNIVFI